MARVNQGALDLVLHLFHRGHAALQSGQNGLCQGLGAVLIKLAGGLACAGNGVGDFVEGELAVAPLRLITATGSVVRGMARLLLDIVFFLLENTIGSVVKRNNLLRLIPVKSKVGFRVFRLFADSCGSQVIAQADRV